MITCGIDVGAKTVKVVIIKDDNIMGKGIAIMELDRKGSIKEAFDKCLADSEISKTDIDYIVATGSGQKSVDFADHASTVVSCDARGMTKLETSVKTVIDVGANDARAMRCNETGKITDFSVNEKCAAGAGAFVEAMSRAMEVSMEEFAQLSLQSTKSIPINAQCAIFAESEVVSLIHEETDRNDICRAVHEAMVGRIASMARTVRIEEDVALIGGVAYNRGMVEFLKKELDVELIIPEEPEYVGAYGAALLAMDKLK